MQVATAKNLGLVALLGGAIAAAAALAASRGPSPDTAAASSHREAPLIADDPTADNTDLYAFVSPDDPSKVTIVANYIPLEEPAGGPNFHKFGDGVRYNIHIDRTGDARADLTYQFQFETQIQNPDTFLYNTGPITSLDDPDFNLRQTYQVRRLSRGPGKRSAVLGTDIPTPPVNVGPRSTPSYESLAAAAVTDLGDGIKVFAGQRDDPFYVDLGSIFDLGGLRPFNPLHLIPLGAEIGVDGVGGYNTHTIALQVPKSDLTTFGNSIVGIWASADRASIQTFGRRKIRTGGHAVQVSRLGNPLINEVVIPLGEKDYWNAQEPHDDEQFLERYRSPELAGLINALYPPLGNNVPTANRDDLVAVLLTGVKTPDVNLNFTGDVKADMLRLNTAIAPTAPVGQGKRLGVLDGDLAGFPNGRRLEDDVTDIEIRAVACGYGPVVAALTGLCNLTPNNQLGDGVDRNDKPFLSSFPYVGTPHQGYEHEHHVTP
jgi:Domain of unknown function (DUF4331)